MLVIGLIALFALAAIIALLVVIDRVSGVPNSNKPKGKTKI